MTHGLFGKLPARRDFISVDVGRPFLDCWEPWMQQCLSASQNTFEYDWPDIYENAPGWRFWLGPAMCGMSIVGVLQPSVDGLGRAYPLAIHAAGVYASPDLEPQDTWFSAAEQFLAAARSGRQSYDETLAALRVLPLPTPAHTDDGSTIFRVDGGTGIDAANLALPSALAALRGAGFQRDEDDLTIWWSAGTERHPSTVLQLRGMPAPSVFNAMLSGQWSQSAVGASS